MLALQEKEKLEQTLRDFERSLQKLKDCTYHEATQKQEYEKRVRAMAAELRGAGLREQVPSHSPVLIVYIFQHQHQRILNWPHQALIRRVHSTLAEQSKDCQPSAVWRACHCVSIR